MVEPSYHVLADQVNIASKGLSFPLGPCLLTVRGVKYAAAYVLRDTWAYLPVGTPVFVRLKFDTCPPLPALVTRNTMDIDGASGGLGLLLRPSQACKAAVHFFPASHIRALFLAGHRIPPLASE